MKDSFRGREHFSPEKLQKEERPVPKQINLDGESFGLDKIDFDSLTKGGVLLFENADPKSIPNHIDGYEPLSGSIRDQGDRRKRTDFPHRDTDGRISQNVFDVLVLHSVGTNQPHPPITDPTNPQLGPDREYVEPYTFVCDREQLWRHFVEYLHDKPSTTKEWVMDIMGKIANQYEDEPRRSPKDLERSDLLGILRRDIFNAKGTNAAIDNLIVKEPGISRETKTWKEAFFDGLFNVDVPNRSGRGDLTQSQLREFIIQVINSGDAYLHTWQPNQAVVIDNKRMMHGTFDMTGKGGSLEFSLRRGAFNWKDEDLVKV